MVTEILAPAGGMEQLTAAVRCGADAVYLGVGNFNARRNAENFAGGGLERAVAYCHGRGVRCHVTLNTLVTDGELSGIREELRHIAGCGADAVIIQDLAVARLARELVPELPRHASTQMTIHDVHGAKLARELGFSRVVLARELTLDEIRSIAREAEGLEIETFIHGALCMSMSGCCYLSSMLGGRSGNRGLCAQPCRLDFSQGGRDHMLSLKDMSFIRHIRQLRDAGVCSFKIEGRMKRPEYVAAVVTACRAALRGEAPDLESLRAVFSRSGFTDGYLTGQRDRRMFGTRRKEDVAAAKEVLPRLAGLYRKEAQTVPVDMAFALTAGCPAALTVTDGRHAVSVSGAVPERARTRATGAAAVEQALSKTGGTPFLAGKFSLQLEDGLALSMQELNRMRREALDALLARREAPHPLAFRDLPLPALPLHPAAKVVSLRGRFARADQLWPGAESLFEKIILPIEEIQDNISLIEKYPHCLIGELPRMCYPQDTASLTRLLTGLRQAGLAAAYVSNAGTLALARELGFALHGGPELNVLNSLALEEYARLGLQDLTVSFELAMDELKSLGGTLPRGILGYGYLPLMTMRACPNAGDRGCPKGCTGESTLTDRMGKRFRLACHRRKYTVLYNSTPLYIAHQPIAGADFVTLYFTQESSARCRDIAGRFARREAPDFPRTGGLYYRKLL